MQTYELHPLEGVGPIKFGATKDQVRKTLGEPESCHGHTEYFLGSSIQVTYSTAGLVEFIELASDVVVAWSGIELFTTPVSDLVAAISQFSSLATEESEPGYTFTFPEAEVGFWRPTQPDEDDPEDGKYFESVGLGCKGYYSESI
ncbi:MAG: hypothetical protein V7752_08160 [Halopseudomonas sp.]